MEHIYERIRQMRVMQNMTLKQLSELTGLSVSFLSQVERGESSLAITSLQKIAEALGVPITQFFEDYSNPNFTVRVEDRRPFQLEGSDRTYCRLAGDISARELEPLLVVLKPGEEPPIAYSHPGEEFYFVLEGVASFEVDGKEYCLSEGDSFHIPSHLSHTMWNPSQAGQTVLISVLTPKIFP